MPETPLMLEGELLSLRYLPGVGELELHYTPGAGYDLEDQSLRQRHDRRALAQHLCL